jgi:hypothetical protein
MSDTITPTDAANGDDLEAATESVRVAGEMLAGEVSPASGTTTPSDAPSSGDLEAASENPPGRKRGRPRATPRAWDGFTSGYLGDKSRRTVIKRYYAMLAGTVLEATEGQDFGYLCGEGKVRNEILAELGQLEDPDRILEAATVICEQKVKVKDAVAMVRTWRTGKATPGDTAGLVAEIARAIQSYSVRHAGTTPKQVRTALKLIGIEFAEEEDELADDLYLAEPGEEQ